MTRYVLRYTGAGPVPPADVEAVRAAARVVDVAGRNLLVEAPERRMRTVAAGLADWVVAPETTVPVPRTRPRVHAGAARPPR
jgi:hypothetical protein